ncbi:MAG TPA: type II secretion system F family protein [Acidisarcina sp.]
MTGILVAAIGLSVFLMIALLAAPLLMRPSVAERRMLSLVKGTRAYKHKAGPREALRDAILAAAQSFRTRVGLSENEEIAKRLVAAGIRGPRASEFYFIARFLCPLAGVAGGSFFLHVSFFWVLAPGAVGYLLPDFWLRRRMKRRAEKIRRSIPDALDLMVICVDAGLGLDQALQRVGLELSLSHPEINEEFAQINFEQRAGKGRIDAWKSMAERTQIEEFTSFVTMLIQTDRFGTPIIRALSRFAEDMRMKRRQHAEEAAAKTKVKILFPLVLFIFPCIFIVLLAPAVLSIGSLLSTLGK